MSSMKSCWRDSFWGRHWITPCLGQRLPGCSLNFMRFRGLLTRLVAASSPPAPSSIFSHFYLAPISMSYPPHLLLSI
jgi:hypothetical protein